MMSECLEQSWRDDMESIGYLLVYLIRGELPWQGVQAPIKTEKYQLIMEKKMSMTSELLCQGLPGEFQTYMQQVTELSFEEQPNYELYKHLFWDLYQKKGFDFRKPKFDWIASLEKKKNDSQKKKSRDNKDVQAE